MPPDLYRCSWKFLCAMDRGGEGVLEDSILLGCQDNLTSQESNMEQIMSRHF